MRLIVNKFVLIILYVFFSCYLINCAYYNTMFNAHDKYEQGMKKIEKSEEGKITPEIRKDFYAVVDKCWKLINIYSDSSKYADDALLLIGKSHFNVEEYPKSERFLKQFIERYRDSDLIAEAYLWLGRSLLNQDKNDEALEYFNKVLALDESDDLNARAYLSMGEIYFKMEAFDLARTQLNQVSEITNNDELEAAAQYLIASTYFASEDFKTSAAEFDKILSYDVSVDLLFRSIMKKVDCYMELDEYDQAISTLEITAYKGEFLHKKSIIEARIGDAYLVQGKSLEATEIYYNVMDEYPRTVGSAMAAYGMAQLMEFAYSDLDSAKNLYNRVGKEYRDSDLRIMAEKKAKILDQYQKIESNIEKDLADLKILRNTGSVTDTLLTADSSAMAKDKTTKQGDPVKKKKRTENQIQQSLEKNQFAMAEFYLLTLASYDSAEVAYKRFIKSSNDTILVPKAHYALYYINKYVLVKDEEADAVKQYILDNYPTTPYAAYFSANTKKEEKKEEKISPYKYLYLQGEAMLTDENYMEAIQYFDSIAIEDSGSDLAMKSRYASAWIYENKLNDIPSAIETYTTIVQEYPNSEIGEIARNKIIIPEELDEESSPTETDQSLIPADSLNTENIENPFADSLNAEIPTKVNESGDPGKY